LLKTSAAAAVRVVCPSARMPPPPFQLPRSAAFRRVRLARPACRLQRSTPGSRCSAGSRSPGHGCRQTPPGRAGNRWLSAPVCCDAARRHARGSKNGRSQRAPGNDRSGPCARAAGVCCTHAVRMRSTRRKHAGGNGVRWQSRPASERDTCSFSKTAVAIRSTWWRAESSPSVRLCERGG